jgi:hypothetical protein
MHSVPILLAILGTAAALSGAVYATATEREELARELESLHREERRLERSAARYRESLEALSNENRDTASSSTAAQALRNQLTRTEASLARAEARMQEIEQVLGSAEPASRPTAESAIEPPEQEPPEQQPRPAPDNPGDTPAALPRGADVEARLPKRADGSKMNEARTVERLKELLNSHYSGKPMSASPDANEGSGGTSGEANSVEAGVSEPPPGLLNQGNPSEDP